MIECPRCGSSNVIKVQKYHFPHGSFEYQCRSCGARFRG